MTTEHNIEIYHGKTVLPYKFRMHLSCRLVAGDTIHVGMLDHAVISNTKTGEHKESWRKYAETSTFFTVRKITFRWDSSLHVEIEPESYTEEILECP